MCDNLGRQCARFGIERVSLSSQGWPHFYFLQRNRPGKFVFVRKGRSKLTPAQTYFCQVVGNVWVLTDSLEALAGTPNWRDYAARESKTIENETGTRDTYEVAVIRALCNRGLWWLRTTPSIYAVGLPDLLVGRGNTHWWIEVKTGSAILRETQTRLLGKFASFGVRYHVVNDQRTLAEALEV